VDFSLSAALGHLTFWTWGVAIVLTVMSILSVAVAINRAIFFIRARKQSLAFAAEVAEALEGQDTIAVLATSDEKRFRFSYLGRIVSAGLRDAKDVKSKMGDELKNLATVSSAMDRTVADETKAQRRWLTILATVASSAPFVGLLGTVFGIINSFKGMQANESAGISAVAGGIAEALYMTGFGLVVAIPAVWLYNWANANIDSLNVEMTNSSSEMHDWVKKNWKAL
jgi:biopolymer transport protein ExbB/TolQ